jgi:hypothetical protein
MRDLQFLHRVEVSNPVAGSARNMFEGVMMPTRSPPKLFLDNSEVPLPMTKEWDYLFREYWRDVILDMYNSIHASGMYMFDLHEVEHFGKIHIVPKTVYPEEGQVYAEIDPHGLEPTEYYFSRNENWKAINWDDKVKIAYDPSVNFLLSITPIFGKTNLQEWLKYIEGGIEYQRYANPPTAVYNEWQQAPLGRLLPDLFDLMCEKQIYSLKNLKSATNKIVWEDKIPLKNEELDNFVQIHIYKDAQSQKVMHNLGLQKLYSRMSTLEQNRSSSILSSQGMTLNSGAGPGEDQYSYGNPQISNQNVSLMPNIIGNPRYTQEDIANSIHKSLTEAQFDPIVSGGYEHLIPGMMFKPTFVPQIEVPDISSKLERFDLRMSDSHGVFLSGSKSTVKNGAESLKLEVQKNKNQQSAVATRIEAWVSHIMNMIYPDLSDMNFDQAQIQNTIDEIVDKNSKSPRQRPGRNEQNENSKGVVDAKRGKEQREGKEKKEDDEEDDKSQSDVDKKSVDNPRLQDAKKKKNKNTKKALRIIFKFDPVWFIDQSILASINDKFDVELVQDLYARVCDIDPMVLDQYRRNPSEAQKRKERREDLMLHHNRNNPKQLTQDGKKDEEKKEKAQTKRKNRKRKEDDEDEDDDEDEEEEDGDGQHKGKGGDRDEESKGKKNAQKQKKKKKKKGDGKKDSDKGAQKQKRTKNDEDDEMDEE